MTDALHYTKAPIAEAILDVRATLPASVNLADLGAAAHGIKGDYPTVSNAVVFEGQWKVGAEVGATASQKHNGFRCVSADGRQAVDLRLDGFTLSRLSPYDRWETFRDEARRLWTIYRNAVHPLAATRAGLRYVNRLDLPPGDLKEYLRTVPEVSPDLPQEIASYLLHLAIPQPDLDGLLLINQGLVPPAQPGLISVVLDIDVFVNREFPLKADSADESGEAALWELFEKLRVRKNEVFKACLTSRLEEMIR